MEKIMSTRISLDENRLMQYYEDLMDDVYLLYHVHPTNIPNIPLTDSEFAEMSEFTGMVDNFNQKSFDFRDRKNKKTRHFSDPDFSNGIPRRRK